MKIGIRLLVGIVLSLGILHSCQNNEALVTSGEVNENGIAFTSTIDDGQASRAYDGMWEANDEIGLFMLSHETSTLLDENVPYVTRKENGYFVSKIRPIYYPEDGSQVDFIAYYPYNGQVTDYKAYAVDLRDQSAQKAIDLMTAVNLTGRDQNSPQGNLQFKHLLAKLVLNLNSTGDNSLRGIKASVTGLKVKGSANLSDGVITASDEVATVAMYINEEATQAEAVLLPQVLNGKLKIQLELNGQTKEVETQVSGSIEPGVKYICNLQVNYKGGEVVTDPEGQYTKWFETPVITESQLKNYKYVTHYTALGGKSVRNYSLLYNTDLKMAYWVAYPLHTCYTTKGEGVERKDKWIADPLVGAASFQAVLTSGYGDKTYSRGHQCPSNDRVATQEMNNQTFYFTNQTPQRQNKFNGAIWMNLEGRVNSWASASDTVYVVTGAMPKSEVLSENDLIKDNQNKDVVIPAYYFKAVARKISGTYHTIAFKLEHKDYSDSKSYMNYAISVSDLEKETGFTFFPQLDASVKEQLNINLWN